MKSKASKNRFTNEDRAIVRKAIQSALSHDEATIVILRFWENTLPHEIAEMLHVRTAWVLRTLDKALQKLQVFCLTHPDFSRSIFTLFADDGAIAA